MASVNRFEDLKCWQTARKLTREVYEATDGQRFSRDFALRDQITRAAVSTMSNIAEGFERDGSREFLQFLSTAKASAGEVKSHLYVALDRNYIHEDRFRSLYATTDETARIIGGLMRYLKRSDRSGRKYREPDA